MILNKIAVIGAGVMGSGIIAAQIANNGIEVLLYGLENKEGLIASQSINQLVDKTPSLLTHPSIIKNITPLSLYKDLNKLDKCNLVISNC